MLQLRAIRKRRGMDAKRLAALLDVNVNRKRWGMVGNVSRRLHVNAKKPLPRRGGAATATTRYRLAPSRFWGGRRTP